jgi:hypothetical protein
MTQLLKGLADPEDISGVSGDDFCATIGILRLVSHLQSNVEALLKEEHAGARDYLEKFVQRLSGGTVAAHCLEAARAMDDKGFVRLDETLQREFQMTEDGTRVEGKTGGAAGKGKGKGRGKGASETPPPKRPRIDSDDQLSPQTIFFAEDGSMHFGEEVGEFDMGPYVDLDGFELQMASSSAQTAPPSSALWRFAWIPVILAIAMMLSAGWDSG